MTWAVIPGSPHGGPLPTPALDIDTLIGQPGDEITITGSGLTPDVQILLQPGNIVLTKTNPTVTDSITFVIPYGVPNVRYLVTIDNGETQSNSVELFVTRDVTFSAAPGTSILILGAN